MEEWGFLRGCRYLLHDRDTKFCASFRELIESGSVTTIRLPARSPNLNSFAERWVRSVKEECLSRLHPLLAQVGRHSCQAHPPTLQVNEKQDIVSNQPFQGKDFHCEEIRPDQN